MHGNECIDVRMHVCMYACIYKKEKQVHSVLIPIIRPTQTDPCPWSRAHCPHGLNAMSWAQAINSQHILGRICINIRMYIYIYTEGDRRCYDMRHIVIRHTKRTNVENDTSKLFI